jgi:hypothetical protein
MKEDLGKSLKKYKRVLLKEFIFELAKGEVILMNDAKKYIEELFNRYKNEFFGYESGANFYNDFKSEIDELLINKNKKKFDSYHSIKEIDLSLMSW